MSTEPGAAQLDDAASRLPLDKRTQAMKATLASRILSAAARGVHDPMQLRTAALMEVDDENNIHQCYAQLQRLRRQVEEGEACMLGCGRRRLDKHDRDHALQQFATVPPACKRFGDGRADDSLMWLMTDRASVTFIAIGALMVALMVVIAL